MVPGGVRGGAGIMSSPPANNCTKFSLDLMDSSQKLMYSSQTLPSSSCKREVHNLGTWAQVVTIPHASPPFAFVSQQLRDNEAAKVSADQVALKVIMVEFEKAEVLMSEKLHGVSAKQDEMSEKLDGVSAKQDKIIAIATAAAATIAAAAVAIAAAAVAPAFATACAAARTTTRAAR